MDREHSVKGRLLILICYVNYSLQVRHEFVLEDERVFADCLNAPPGSQNVSGLFDFSEITFTMDERGTLIEGNLTSVWNVQPTDEVVAEFSLLSFDRGSWMPTVLNIASKNVCKVLYDEKQYWYTFFFKYVTNVKDVKDMCLSFGTTYIFEPFYLEIFLGFDMPLRSGRYLINIKLTAQDPNGVRRKNSVCLAIRGEIHKIA